MALHSLITIKLKENVMTTETAIPMGEAHVEKDLIELSTGHKAEAIYFSRPEKQVICFSTQLSCAVGCAFCASPGKMKTINISTDDMLEQINVMYGTYASHNKAPMLYSFMGEGEPFLNYKNVLETMRVIEVLDPTGKISVSTSGVNLNAIQNFAHEKFDIPVKLQVSVHSMVPEIREWLIPLAKSIEGIKRAIEYYHEHNDGPVELNFALIDGVNDTDDDIQMIIDTFRNEYIKLTKFNEVPFSKMKSSKRREYFFDELVKAKLTVEYHETDGAHKFAACGMTRGKQL